jgi:predicted phage-related endonuclease
VACTDPPDGCENAVFEEETPSQKLVAFQSKAAAIMQTIADISRQKDALDAQDKEMRTQLQAAMEEYGVDKFENDVVSLTYVKASVRSSVDGKKLLAKFPDAYAACLKESPVKASVRIKVK